MKKKNDMKVALASTVMLLMASPAFAQKYKVAKVERTRILVDQKWDALPDAEATRFIAPYKSKVDSIMGPVVGHIAHDMTRHRPESKLSNLLCDILVWGGKQFEEQPVFAVYNMGGIRSNLAKGKVTVGDVNDMAPFENKICFLTLKGDKVLELFQQIAHRGGEGLSHAVRMVITKDGKLKSVTLNGEPVDPEKCYRVATLDYLAEGNDTGAGQQHHGIQFNQVGQDGGVLHGGGGVGAEEAAAVGAQVLDDFKRRHRPHPQNLIRAFQGLHHDILREILRHTLPYQQQPAHQGEGQQHAGGDANQIGKEVAYMIFCLAGQAADERDTGGIAAGCGNKHHKDDDQHLGEVAQAAFAGVVLQVGVGHKTNDGIKGQVRLHALNPVGIQKGNALDAENHIANSHHHRVGAQQGQGVLFPVHALLRVHAAQLVNDPVDPIHNGVGKGVFSCGDMIKIPPHWNNKDQINDACQDQLYHTKNLLYSVLDLKTDPDAPGRIPDIRPAAKQ